MDDGGLDDGDYSMALTASACWDVDAGSQLSLAEHGDILSQFQMLFPDQRAGSDPGAWDRHLNGLSFGAGAGWRASGLRAVCRATGAGLGPGRSNRAANRWCGRKAGKVPPQLWGSAYCPW